MTEKWKEVWSRPVNAEKHPRFVHDEKSRTVHIVSNGLTYGPHVAALMAQGVLANPNNSQGDINWGEVLLDAKALCKQIAEMEGEA